MGTSWSAAAGGAPCGNYVLNGTKLFVADAVAATHLLVAVRTARRTRHQPAGGRYVEAGRPPPAGCRLPELAGGSDFQGRRGVGGALLGPPARTTAGTDSSRRWNRIPVMCASEVGGSQAVFDMSWLQPDPHPVRHTDRAISAGAGSHHPPREPAGTRPAGRRTRALEAGDGQPARADVQYGQGVRARRTWRRATPRTRYTPASAPRASTAWCTHADVAHPLPLPRRPSGTSAAWPTRWRGRRRRNLSGTLQSSGRVERSVMRYGSGTAARSGIARFSPRARRPRAPLAVNLRLEAGIVRQNQRVRLAPVGGRERVAGSSTQRWAEPLR